MKRKVEKVVVMGWVGPPPLNFNDRLRTKISFMSGSGYDYFCPSQPRLLSSLHLGWQPSSQIASTLRPSPVAVFPLELHHSNGVLQPMLFLVVLGPQGLNGMLSTHSTQCFGWLA